MMLFKNSFEHNQGLHFVYEHLKFTSGLGRNRLLELPFCTDAATLQHEFDLLENVIHILQNDTFRSKLMHLRNNLHQINDIRPTLNALSGGTVLDDIQLFEIKKTAILTRNIAADLKAMNAVAFELKNTDAAIAMLDPEHTNIPHFYIYSAYDPELAALRKQVTETQDINLAEQLRFKTQQIEDRIRTHLSEQLQQHNSALRHNLETLAHLDLLMAKAQLAVDWNACRPEISDHTELTRFYNPEVSEALKTKGRSFQPIDIKFGKETILITGANMAGKSVILKTISLCQYLFQFGFFVPAASAAMTLQDEIISSIGDKQSELSGLSSFAVEILTIDRIIKSGRAGKRVLALVDELARTTNPEEGKQLVNGFLRLAKKLGITAIVTTHYSGIATDCRRLRVKGLHLNPNDPPTVGNISDKMDYSLVETDGDEVPREAFSIATLLGIDKEFLAMCQTGNEHS